MTTLNVYVPRTTPAPRGAQTLGRWAAAALNALTPRAKLSTATRTAAKARAVAHSYDQTDPRFAADLYAAADHDEAVRGV